MKSFSESSITTLQIVKPDLVKKFYEIRAGEELFGTLDIFQQGATAARIETHQGSFIIKRHGFFKPYVVLRNEKFDTSETRAYLDLAAATKVVLGDMPFYFRAMDFWRNQWGWTNEKNQMILKYKPTVAGTVRGDVEFTKDFFYLPVLELVTMLGIYFLVQLDDEVTKHNEIL